MAAAATSSHPAMAAAMAAALAAATSAATAAATAAAAAEAAATSAKTAAASAAAAAAAVAAAASACAATAVVSAGGADTALLAAIKRGAEPAELEALLPPPALRTHQPLAAAASVEDEAYAERVTRWLLGAGFPAAHPQRVVDYDDRYGMPIVEPAYDNALDLAAARQCRPLVQLLLAAGATVDAPDGSEHAPLLSAVLHHGDEDIALDLIAAGASVEHSSTTCQPVWYYACANRRWRAVVAMAERYARPGEGYSFGTHNGDVLWALIDAEAPLPVIQRLCELGWAAVIGTPDDGRSPASRAVAVGRADVVEYFRSVSGAGAAS